MARPTDKGLISKSKLTAIADQIRRLFGVTDKFTMDRCAQELGSIVLRNNNDLTLNIGEGVHVNVPSGYYQTTADYAMKDLLPPAPTITKEFDGKGFGMKITARSTSTEAGYLRDGRQSNPTTTYISPNAFASGDLNVTQNGTYNTIYADDKFYKTVTVNVPMIDPTQWDTWVINEDLSNMYFQGEYDRLYTCPIILFDGRVASNLNPYAYDNGSTAVQTLGFYLDRTTRIEVYSGEDSPGTWTDQRYRTIKVPAFIKTYPKGSESTGGGYGSLYAFLQEYATRQT